ncbi:hypothetical protein ACS0TY_001665 [Phlomoides rotata]
MFTESGIKSLSLGALDARGLKFSTSAGNFNQHVTEGWKAKNGFRAGFQRELEKGVRKLLPGTDIVATPHINSKIHVWKKEYGALSDLLSKSGIGWNSTTSMIEVEDEAVWDGCKRADPHVKGIRFKTWPYYPHWIEIFGMIERLDNNICKPSKSTLKTLNKGKKRKNSETDLTNLVDSLGEFMKSSTVAMGDYGKGTEKEYPLSYETMKLNEIMKGIVGLKVSDKLKVCDELIQNTKQLVLFFSLPPDEQEEYVWMLLDRRL